MNQAPKKQVGSGKKRAASQTQSYGVPLARAEAETCAAYLSAMGCQKSAAGWSNPPEKDFPDNFSIVGVAGVPTATVKEKTLSGYDLVTWLVLGSSSKGMNLIKMGALVLTGIHNLSWFEELKDFDHDDPENSALKVMKVVAAAATFFQGTSGENEVAVSAFASAEVLDSAVTFDDNELGKSNLPDDSHGNGGREQKFVDGPESNEDAAVPTSVTINGAPEQPAAIIILDGQIATMSAEDADPPDASVETDAVTPGTDDSEIQALLNAFNGKVISEETCIKTGKRQAIEQFCHEIQLGRLLILKKHELKITALYKKWKAENLPEAEWGKAVLSRCSRYGMYEKRMKSKRGLLLQEIDVKNCTKKAMLLIGGYKKKNVDGLIDAVCALLDGGKVVNEEVASKLVHKFREKLEPKTAEATPPPVPTTITELFDLPKDWHSPYGKKHLADFHELLDAIEQLDKSQTEEAALVLPLIKMFTAF